MGQQQTKEEKQVTTSSEVLSKFSEKFSKAGELSDTRFGRIDIYQKNEGPLEYVFLMTINFQSKQEFNNYVEELNLRSAINHENILKIFGYKMQNIENLCGSNNIITVYVEFIDQSLQKNVASRKTMTPQRFYEEIELWIIMENIVSAGQHLQRSGYHHGDIRPFNIFLKDPLEAKLADNSFLNAIKNNYFKKLCGDQDVLLAPEQLDLFQKKVTSPDYDFFKADIYSLGMTLLGAANLMDPLKICYDFHNIAILHNKVDDLLQQTNKIYGYELCDLIRCMLMQNVESRPSWDELYLQIQRDMPPAARMRIEQVRIMNQQNIMANLSHSFIVQEKSSDMPKQMLSQALQISPTAAAMGQQQQQQQLQRADVLSPLKKLPSDDQITNNAMNLVKSPNVLKSPVLSPGKKEPANINLNFPSQQQNLDSMNLISPQSKFIFPEQQQDPHLNNTSQKLLPFQNQFHSQQQQQVQLQQQMYNTTVINQPQQYYQQIQTQQYSVLKMNNSAEALLEQNQPNQSLQHTIAYVSNIQPSNPPIHMQQSMQQSHGTPIPSYTQQQFAQYPAYKQQFQPPTSRNIIVNDASNQYQELKQSAQGQTRQINAQPTTAQYYGGFYQNVSQSMNNANNTKPLMPNNSMKGVATQQHIVKDGFYNQVQGMSYIVYEPQIKQHQHAEQQQQIGIPSDFEIDQKVQNAIAKTEETIQRNAQLRVSKKNNLSNYAFQNN